MFLTNIQASQIYHNSENITKLTSKQKDNEILM